MGPTGTLLDPSAQNWTWAQIGSWPKLDRARLEAKSFWSKSKSVRNVGINAKSSRGIAKSFWGIARSFCDIAKSFWGIAKSLWDIAKFFSLGMATYCQVVLGQCHVFWSIAKSFSGIAQAF